jgi:GntR family transcriptional regulator, vanillate catabolism transcriptional regulator
VSQTTTALLTLRQLILDGELQAGQRLSEPSIAERLKISRTPIRAALANLAEEGLLEVLPRGGYAVSRFTEREVRDAIEIRGVLEGLAARLVAQRGARGSGLADLKDLLSRMDEMVARRFRGKKDFESYVEVNATFHALLIELADSAPLSRQYARAIALPFASPSGFVTAQGTGPQAVTILLIAQEHHRAVVEAIENSDGGRAEALMCEHARLAHRNLELALRDPAVLGRVPGLALMRGRVGRVAKS